MFSYVPQSHHICHSKPNVCNKFAIEDVEKGVYMLSYGSFPTIVTSTPTLGSPAWTFEKLEKQMSAAVEGHRVKAAKTN